MNARMVTCCLLLIGLLLSAAPIGAQSPEGTAPFTVSVCRTDQRIDATVEVPGSASVHVGWVLDWNTNTDFAEDDFWVKPGHSRSIVIDVPEQTDPYNLVFFWIPDNDTWFAGYEFFVADMPLCEFEHEALKPGCVVPKGTAMVRFVSDTDLLWYPDPLATTGYQVATGQTAWMIDVQDDFVAIVWSCDLLWVACNAVESPGNEVAVPRLKG